MLSKDTVHGLGRGTVSTDRLWGLLVLLSFLPMLFGLGVPVISPDGAVYAQITKEMVLRNDYLSLYHLGQDWLDKPHLQFWITALSFRFFGINEIGYRVPGILVTALGAAYTFALAQHLHGRRVAQLACLFFLTALHLVISVIDLRAEAYVAAFAVAATYHLVRVQQRSGARWLHLVLGALFAAAGMMTKGMVALLPVGFALVGEMALKRQWRQFLRWEWPVAVALVGLFILPEVYAVYQQFDAHPEKVVFGRTGVSGVSWFLWDSQWGRFSNEGPIKGGGDFFHLYHTLLWAFLPWPLLLYAALFRKLRDNIPRLDRDSSFFLLVGSWLSLFLFSLSSFQLAHYVVMLFPFFAIFTAQYLVRLSGRRGDRFLRLNWYIPVALYPLGLLALHLFMQPERDTTWFWLYAGALLALMVGLSRLAGIETKYRIAYQMVVGALLFNGYLGGVFYPELLDRQADDKAGRFVNEHPIEGYRVGTFAYPNSGFSFYAEPPTQNYEAADLADALDEAGLYLFTNADGLEQLRASGYRPVRVQTFQHSNVTVIGLQLIDPEARSKITRPVYLLRLDPTRPSNTR